jgi:steroid delta-isomerase-like uncharacterized protein
MSTTEDNTELVRSYLRAFNDRDWEALTDHLAPDVVEHGVHETLDGPDEILSFLRSYFEVFPDYEGRTETTVAEGDTVAVRYSATGTHSDRYHDVDPTAHAVTWTGMAMYRVEDGRIAEVWVEEDRIGLLEQLEAVDPPAHLRI